MKKYTAHRGNVSKSFVVDARYPYIDLPYSYDTSKAWRPKTGITKTRRRPR